MTCIVDASNIINISFSIACRQLQEKNGKDYEFNSKDVPFFYHIFIRYLMPVFTTYKKIIFCFEGLNSTAYRKKIYSAYKQNREAGKKTPEYKIIKEQYSKVEDLLKLFPCKLMRVENCEADDLIHKICEIEYENEEIIVISADGDFVQLMNYYPSVKVYNPIKKNFVKLNPNILLEKCLIGDRGDGILGVPKIGLKTFEKMLNDKAEWNKRMTPQNIELMETIMKIVDLRKFPKDLQDNIGKIYKATEYNNFNKDAIEAFFLNNGMVECLSSWGANASKIDLCLSSKKTEVDLDKLLDI